MYGGLGGTLVMDGFYIILVGSLVAVSCALLGCWLILRKMAMVGDAISHAILPGIVIAFLATGTRNTGPMLFWACMFGLLSTVLIEWLHQKARLQTDAAIGVTFTWLFAIGVILVSVYSSEVDLDQDCVLYGEIAYVPLDLWVTGSGWNLGPKVAWILGGVLTLVVTFVTLGYKELQLSTFDAEFARFTGMRTQIWHYSLMSLVSLVTVTAFEAVGAILVVALLVVPAAVAYLLVNSLRAMLLLAALVGVVCSVGGYGMAVVTGGSIAGAMATAAGLLLLLTAVGTVLLRRFVSKADVKMA